MSHQTIIVLDFGSQYTQLIARRLRELSVYSEIWPFNTPIERLRERNPAGVILSGGPSSVSDEGAPISDPAVFSLGHPVLGICYGMQVMTAQLGGEVGHAAAREYGDAIVSVRSPDTSRILRDVPEQLKVWASHG
ncbi:MAG TPA: gamma-glutamyl-gamma-aminobutyrate hydrolase family protein, partial [Vicinamibacterales bacterium]|nr:gamma-glutamyl-gamma-aminobutyrate hydrolase family protein [Vicinamibacterales bacterium]